MCTNDRCPAVSVEHMEIPHPINGFRPTRCASQYIPSHADRPVKISWSAFSTEPHTCWLDTLKWKSLLRMRAFPFCALCILVAAAACLSVPRLSLARGCFVHRFLSLGRLLRLFCRFLLGFLNPTFVQLGARPSRVGHRHGVSKNPSAFGVQTDFKVRVRKR